MSIDGPYADDPFGAHADRRDDGFADHEADGRSAAADRYARETSAFDVSAPDDADDPALDDEFPLGDGVADVSATVWCPYCGEACEVAVDPGSGAHQEYVEDCAVCCRPWRVTVSYAGDGSAQVWAETADGE